MEAEEAFHEHLYPVTIASVKLAAAYDIFAQPSKASKAYKCQHWQYRCNIDIIDYGFFFGLPLQILRLLRPLDVILFSKVGSV